MTWVTVMPVTPMSVSYTHLYPTERLLTLSTCTYQMEDARMVILARPLRDGETTAADEVHINSDPLLPARWPAGK